MTSRRSIRLLAPMSTTSRRAVVRGLAGGGLLTAVSLATGRRLAAQDATPAAVPPLIEEWLAVWGDDPAGADTVYTEDAVLEDVAFGVAFRGRDELKAHIEAEFVGFPDHTYELRSGFVAGDFAAAEFTFTGTYTGSYPELPPGEGQAVTLKGAAIFELSDGKIRREAHYYDAYAFLIQLGLLPAPGAEADAEAERTLAT